MLVGNSDKRLFMTLAPFSVGLLVILLISRDSTVSCNKLPKSYCIFGILCIARILTIKKIKNSLLAVLNVGVLENCGGGKDFPQAS